MPLCIWQHPRISPGLQPGTRYTYSVGDPYFNSWSRQYNFTMPKAPALANLPLHIAIMGDPGQSSNTSDTLRLLMERRHPEPDLLINAGDCSYADNFYPDGRDCLYCNNVTCV